MKVLTYRISLSTFKSEQVQPVDSKARKQFKGEWISLKELSFLIEQASNISWVKIWSSIELIFILQY